MKRKRLKITSKPRSRRGRPTKLSTALSASYCRLIEQGYPVETAADQLRIARSTAWRWLKLGEQHESNPEEEALAVYGRFRASYLVARATFLGRMIAELTTGSPAASKWRRALSVLERRDRENWCRQADLGENDVYDPDERFL